MMMMTPVLYRLTAALIAALALGSLALQLHLGLERWPGRTLWVESWRMGRYFTVLTNLLLGLSCAAIALGWRARDSWLAGLVLWIGIVGIVYHALLARELEGLRRLADAGQHTVVPLLTLLWWMMFAPKRGLAPRHAVWWLSWPAIYVAYALVRGEIDGRHPYFFVEPPLIGWPAVGLWVLGLGAAFWSAGRALVALGQWLSRPSPPAGAAPDGPRSR
jgi:hypothetical protein